MTQATLEMPAPLPARSNLPAALTSFVGRTWECAATRRLLIGQVRNGESPQAQDLSASLQPVESGPTRPTSSAVRLLTLTGPGGAGKTRLALETAATLPMRYSDGVWLVELATLSEPALVAQAVASVFGVRETRGLPLDQTLVAMLRPRHLLLILDNCEHLAAACAQLVETLLRACPRLQVLATSREPLALAGEVVWPVPPLSTPDPARLPSPSRLLEFEAVRLFCDRARAAVPGFAPALDEWTAIAQICHHLDGVPLAIELAAARVRLLTVAQIAARLDDRFRFLVAGNRTAPARQQTLRAAIDWSHGLLSEPEQIVFRRLAVFAGGWTLDAAEHVVSDDGFQVTGRRGDSDAVVAVLTVAAPDVLDLLTHLVDKSLVTADDGASNGDDAAGDEVRYRMLETIREYAGARLQEAGELQQTRDQHAAWLTAGAESAEPELSGAQQSRWLARLDADHDNFRQALRWSVDRAHTGETDDRDRAAMQGLRLAAALWRFWYMRGHFAEGRSWLRLVLDVPPPEFGTAETPATTNGGDRHGPGVLAAGWQKTRANALNGAGGLAHMQGDDDVARALYLESLSIRRTLGDRVGIAASLNNLGVLARASGAFDDARRLFEEAVAINRALSRHAHEAVALNNLSSVAAADGDCVEARTLLDEALRLHREAQDRWGEAMSLCDLGTLARREGDLERAQASHTAALVAQFDLGDRAGVAWSLASLAMVAALAGDQTLAARLFGASEALREALGAPIPPLERDAYARCVAITYGALEHSRRHAPWEEGRSLSLDEAVTYAIWA